MRKKHKIKPTSLLAYAEVLENLGERQNEVLKCLDTFECATNMMIAERLGWSINRVVPRVFELRKKGLVYKYSTAPCEITKRNAIYWKFRKK